jgi:opacity protein-like surface antigen
VSGVTLVAEAFAADSGFYASVGVGRAHSERSVSSFESFDGDDFSYELGVGYRFGRHLAIQAAWHDFGGVGAIINCPPELLCIADPGTNVVPTVLDEASVDGLSLQLVGTLPLAELPVELFAKAGAMRWDSDWRHNPGLNESGTDFMYGLGVNWNAGDRWSLQLAYQDVDLDVRSFNLGASFRF